MFIAPDAPAPIEIHNIETKIIKGWIEFGAKTRPHMEVKTARLITLGLSKVKKSSTELSLSEDLFFETLATFEIKIYIHRHQIVVRSYLTFGMLSYE